MWYWLADALFWQLSIDHSSDVQYQVEGSHVTTSYKNTWDTVPYFGLTDLLMILDSWSTLLSLSKLLAVQDHAQNLEDQLWIEGRRGWVLYLTNVWVAAISVRKVGFSWECFNIFATGCSLKVWHFTLVAVWCGQADGHMVTWLSIFLGWIDNQIFLAMGLRLCVWSMRVELYRGALTYL